MKLRFWVVLGFLCSLSGFADELTIRSIAPKYAGVAGGARVAIEGTGFTATTQVYFDATPCANVSIESPQTILCDAPAHVAGQAKIVLRDSPALETQLAEPFTYFEPLRFAREKIVLIKDEARKIDVTGGVAPITFELSKETLTSHCGDFDPQSRYYRAPYFSICDAVLVVTDSIGNRASLNISVNEWLSAHPQGINSSMGWSVPISETMTVVTEHGAPPYAYSIVSGPGSIDSLSGLFKAPAVAGKTVVRIADSDDHHLDIDVITYRDGSITNENTQQGRFEEGRFGVGQHAELVTSDEMGRFLVLESARLDIPRYLEIARYNPDRTFDLTFSQNRSVLIPFPVDITGMKAVSLIATNKVIWLVGNLPSSSTESRIFVVRLNSNGVLDQAFGTKGVLFQSLGSFFRSKRDWAVAATAQPDGKLVLAGRTCVDGKRFVCQPVVIRLTATGKLDRVFGHKGIVRFPKDVSGYSGALALQSDGRILAAFDHTLWRLGVDGKVDLEFSNRATSLPDENFSYASTLLVGADGSIVFGGYETNNYIFKRLDAEGHILRPKNHPDLDWITIPGRFERDTYCGAPANESPLYYLDNQNRVVIAGFHSINGWNGCDVLHSQLEVWRVNADGDPDPNFGSFGHVFREFERAGSIAEFAGLSAQGNLQIVSGKSETRLIELRY